MRPRCAISARSTSHGMWSTAWLSSPSSRARCTATRQLDRVIDLNFYPIPATKRSNLRWRPVGLGVMGLQDVFFQLGLPFDDPAARTLSKRIAEEIYFHALTASADLAEHKGKHPAFDETRTARGDL